MKLLVGGDSFAQFPNGEWYKSFAESHITDKHWCQLIDKNAVSIGYGAGDIYTTSFVTIQRILQDTSFTHCIFFITSVDRDIIQTNSRRHTDIAVRTTHNNFIDNYENNFADSGVAKTDTEYSNYKFVNFENIFKNEENDIVKGYFHTSAEFKNLHTKLSCLSLIKTFCDRNNIKLLFVAPFEDANIQEQYNFFTNTPVFDFRHADINWFEFLESKECNNYTSHLTNDMHLTVANHFHKIYPNWLDK